MVTPGEVRAAERICVIGCSGAGKSTLSRTLGVRLDLPVVHFDKLHWAPGWVERSQQETQARIDAALEAPRWVTDGNYSRYSARRYREADIVIWLDYPRRICLRRVAKRIWTTYGVVRPDMGEGCPEQLDAEFIRWVWNWHRDQRPGLLTKMQALETPLLWFRHPTQTARWLETL